MEVRYTSSYNAIALNQPTTVDWVLNFTASRPTGSTSRIPLNLSLVLDRSGSMGGQSLKYAIAAACKLVDYLTPDDFLSVVIYDDIPETIVPAQAVNNASDIKQKIRQIRARGLTNLSGGWLMGCDRVKENQSPEAANRVLLLTDGIANLGTTTPQVLINTARKQAEDGIITTTLGFGNYFNEDLLVGMANAAGGNFYFIQTPDDAEDVFRIELESLVSLAAQNLTLSLELASGIENLRVLNNYRTQTNGNRIEVFLGDVYAVEPKPLAIEADLPGFSEVGERTIATANYSYQIIDSGSIQQQSGQLAIAIQVADEATPGDKDVPVQTTRLRIAKAKEEAIAMADRGEYAAAAQMLRELVDRLLENIAKESFEIAEEIEQLHYYAQQLESRQFGTSSRKEMRDQSFQARSRSRKDLELRGVSGSTDSLEAVSSADGGILVECVREGGKLRVRVISEGYDRDFNVQFPRAIREEGATYVVEEIQTAKNGSFYRASGEIKLYVPPGQERKRSTKTTSKRSLQAAKAVGSVADLETTDTVGDGILIQCVKDGKKIRARVVSDGYNPDYNVRFPRNVREEGMLFVVDGIKETAQGGSYIACGKIRRLVQ